MTDSMTTLERELLHECERIADAFGFAVYVTDRDDDADQPDAYGVWVDGGACGVDLISSSEHLAEALSDAMSVMRGWE